MVPPFLLSNMYFILRANKSKPEITQLPTDFEQMVDTWIH